MTHLIWCPNPQSIPNGSYRVMSCLFVTKLRGLDAKLYRYAYFAGAFGVLAETILMTW